jgi:hypothetical protein
LVGFLFVVDDEVGWYEEILNVMFKNGGVFCGVDGW